MNSNKQLANNPTTIQPVEIINLVSDSDSDDTSEVMLIEPKPTAPNLQSNGVNEVRDSSDNDDLNVVDEELNEEEEEDEEVEEDNYPDEEEEENYESKMHFIEVDANMERRAYLEYDKYCWKCHRIETDSQHNPLIHCLNCPLGWHRKCSSNIFKNKTRTLIMTSKDAKLNALLKKDQQWIGTVLSGIPTSVCIECVRQELGYQFNMRLGIFKLMFQPGTMELEQHRYSCIFQYAINSLSDQTSIKRDSEVKTFAHFEQIDYGDVDVVSPIDFDLIREISRVPLNYMSTEEFMFDIKTLCHNYIIWQRESGRNTHEAAVKQCEELKKWALIETEAIDLCHSCYRNRYEVDSGELDDDRVMPCEEGHSLVYALFKGEWWPAKVYPYRQTYYYYKSEEYVWLTFLGVDKKDATTWRRIQNGTTPNIKTFASARPGGDHPSDGPFKALRRKATDDAMRYINFWKKYYCNEYDLQNQSEDFGLGHLYQHPGGIVKNIDHFGNIFKLELPFEEEEEDEEEGEEEEEEEEEEVQPVPQREKRDGADTIGHVPKKAKICKS